MKIAIVGCSHGELEKIYDSVEYLEGENNCKIDILLCCGDFQAIRNEDDLECMAVPPKYKDMCTFYKYYSGEKTAPILTIVIGGNHEASNYFQELAYGGWIAPNIYYLGYASVVNVANIRIAGLSGIFKGKDFYKGHFEKAPYREDTIRSCYHIRALDVFRLKQVSRPVDIMLSHDWPDGIYQHGDIDQLLKKKPFFQKDIDSNSLGSKPAAELLEILQPTYWFAAHLHVKFPALFKNTDGTTTKFLALDKCLPRRPFLQILDVPHEGEIKLQYDLEWLAILQLTNHLLSIKSTNAYLPGPGSDERWKFTPTEKELEALKEKLGEDLTVPNDFIKTVAPYPSSPQSSSPLTAQVHPNTTTFCRKLGIDDPIALLLQSSPVVWCSPSPNKSKLEENSFNVSRDSEDEKLCRTPMKLPLPRSSLQLPAPTSLSSPDVLDLHPSVSAESTPIKPEEADSAVKDDSTYSGPKKFRRRNIAIYCKNDSD